MARIYLDDYVVEYSLSQNSFNILTWKELLNKNARMILGYKKSSDYMVIGVATTREEADNLKNHFLQQLEENENQ